MTRLIDVLALSGCVAADAAREPEIGRAAIAWTFINRAREAARHRFSQGASHPAFGDGSVRDACLRYRPAAGPVSRLDDPVQCRALATACLVCCSDIADPTRGATYYHHHTVHPSWTNSLTPVALIGSYLFYRPLRQGQL